MDGDTFDTPLYLFLGKRAPIKGDVGIEIEAEGPRTGDNPMGTWEDNRMKLGIPCEYWTCKGDNSLRNGAEYVMKEPVRIDDLGKAMDEWVKFTKGTRFRHDSIRTSVHYHINVSSLTLNEILAIITGWWLIETPVVDLQGPTRVGNLFCLRVSDAEHLVTDVLASLEHDPTPLLGGNLADNVKYAACNLNAIRRFGSIEFRFNKGTTDAAEIAKWGAFLFNMTRILAVMKTPTRVLEYYDKAGTANFFRSLVPFWIDDMVRTMPGWEDKIRTNYSYAYMLKTKLEEINSKQTGEVREIVRPFIAINPDVDEYPWEVDKEVHGDRFDFDVYSPDEDQIPFPKFVIGKQRKGRRIKNFMWDAPPMPQQPDPQLMEMLNAMAPPPMGDDDDEDVDIHMELDMEVIDEED